MWWEKVRRVIHKRKRKPPFGGNGNGSVYSIHCTAMWTSSPLTPYAQSHFFLTLCDCARLWVKSSRCPASSGDIKRCCLAEFERAWAHRIAAGITQSEMLLLQGWFRTIMEKLCGGFSVNHTEACTHMHTFKRIHTHHMDLTGTYSLEQLRKSTHKYIAYVVGLDSQYEGNTVTSMHRTWRVIFLYTLKGGVWDCLTASKSHVTGPKLSRGVSFDMVWWGAP